MASEPIRDPVSDHLLTPKNSALIIIDYQPVQVNSIASKDRQLLINNIVGVAKIGLAYGLPIIHSTVNVKTGLNKPPIPQLRGRRGVCQSRQGDGPQEVDHDRVVDRGLPDLSFAGRAVRGLRGLSGGGCGGWHLGRLP